MNLIGEVLLDGTQSYLYLKDLKDSETFILLSSDNGHDGSYINNRYEIPLKYTKEHILEIYKRLKVSGKVYAGDNISTLERILALVSFARTYTFAPDDIITQTSSYAFAELHTVYIAKDSNLSVNIETSNGLLSFMEIESPGFKIHLETSKFNFPKDIIAEFAYRELNNIQAKSIKVSSLKDIHYSDLEEHLDMSWYMENGECKKDYKAITTKAEFDEFVVLPILKKLADCKSKGEKLLLSLDTETTGLFIYNLAKDNEVRDHCVAIPMSWEDDQGVVIFTDMAEFNNVPNKDVIEFLTTLLSNFKGEHTLSVGKKDTVADTVQQMNSFDLFEAEEENSVKNDEGSNEYFEVTFSRNDIDLVGHNAMFDRRVIYGEDGDIWFDDDTLQMCFDLYPSTVKNSKGLKNVTRKLFHHETPELSDILGKGNEDKYRYLKDKLVAIIYGCADADYTRKSFKVLKSIMSKRMLITYRKQDIPLINILAISEYYGVNTFGDQVIALAEVTEKNIELLKDFAYHYAGAYIDYMKKRMFLEKKRDSGVITNEEYLDSLHNIHIDKDSLFKFEFKASDIRTVMYDIFKYPITAFTEGNKKGTGKALPKTDKYVMKKLMREKLKDGETPFMKLDRDIISTEISYEQYMQLKEGTEGEQKKAKDYCLVSAKEFNSLKYPLALLFSIFATINKEYTAYYKPIRENNLEDKIFKSYSMARIETRRISNPVQTMKGNLKALVKAYTPDHYMLDFDMSQVEYRIMLSLAKHVLMIDRMKNPEKDYHTETASLINGIPAHRIGKKQRKSAKSVSFGVPYGLTDMSLAESLFGKVTKETLFMTRVLLDKWASANNQVMQFLNKVRDDALKPDDISKELRNFADLWERDEDGNYLLDELGEKIPTPVSLVKNEFGFYRIFSLKDVDMSPQAKNRRASGVFTGAEAKIRRPAGNYPIQSFAAELFRIILTRFYNRCEEEGINDKIIWHMLIHDELLCSVHKSLHPFYIYKIVKEACMITIPEHTSYFVGINIGNTWAETKDDAREAPVYFVERMIERWDNGDFGEGPFWFDDPWEELIKDERAKYVEERIGELIHEIQPNIDNEPINIPLILQKFENYTVRAYVNDYSKNFTVNASDFDMGDEAEAESYSDLIWCSRFETWCLAYFGEGKECIDYYGHTKLLKCTKEEIVEKQERVENAALFGEDSDSSYWSFDEQEASDIYESDYVVIEDKEDDTFDYDYVKESNTKAVNIAQMVRKETKYKNIRVLGEQIWINCSDTQKAAKIQEYLEDKIRNKGKHVIFQIGANIKKWHYVKSNLDLSELDTYIESLTLKKEKLKHIKVFSNKVIIKILNRRELEAIKGYLIPCKGQGLLVFAELANGDIKPFGEIKRDTALKPLDEIIENTKRKV